MQMSDLCVQGTTTSMQKLCLIRILKQESMVVAGQQYVAENLGANFVEPKPVSLTAVWKESSNATPIIFVLSSGVCCFQLADTINYSPTT